MVDIFNYFIYFPPFSNLDTVREYVQFDASALSEIQLALCECQEAVSWLHFSSCFRFLHKVRDVLLRYFSTKMHT